MAGIIDYIKWRGDLSFNQSPFCTVDNLIFSELSYMSFIDIIKVNQYSTLKEVADIYLEGLDKNKPLGLLLTGEFYLMLELMAASQRYGDLIIRGCVEIIDDASDIQFSAMTIELNKDVAYIAFRGTDDRIVGWKEDFQMSFLDEVPAQREALRYLQMIQAKYDYKHIIIGGHSKGGNLAIYSGVHSDDTVKERIINIYNNDGPGFKHNLLEDLRYQAISEKIVTLLPQSSIVGMLLEHEESYNVVKSHQMGLLQHDGFSWDVMGDDFIYLSTVDKTSKRVDKTIRNTLESMSEEQIKAFTDTVFEILSSTDNTTLVGLKKDGIKALYHMSKKFSTLDKESKQAVTSLMSKFIGEGSRNLMDGSHLKPINPLDWLKAKNNNSDPL